MNLRSIQVGLFGLFGLLVLLVPALMHAQDAPSPAPPADNNPWAPDRAEPGSVESIREHTTEARFLPETVAYVPESDTVPSPTDVLGRIIGTPDELSRVADIYGYFRRLDEASDRVTVQTIGRTEEGRDLLLVAISDAENLAQLDRWKDINARLADPRSTTREDARRLAAEGKVVYHLLGGLHSAETGSPEMLMELAYRLAVSEKPEIQEIRRNSVILITPVAEPDGRDRVVDWYYRHVKNRKGTWDELREFMGPPYWGHYAFHDNNRDGMQVTLALTQAIHEAWFAWHPQVMHDLHESVPLLYISTGHGPYSRAVDPVTIHQWTQFGDHDAGALASLGLPGVWVWGFWDGWWPGYLFSVANSHHGIGRFYETFGNSHPGTFDRTLERARFAGKAVTDTQWYRPWPPEKKLRWSLRNNTNYMEAGVLEALGYAALHRKELLEDFWVKGARALEKGRTEAPYAWVFPLAQRDSGRLEYLLNQLRKHRIEIHQTTADVTIGEKTWPAGTFVVRMDQPYRNAAINFLEEQKFPADEANEPYDDIAWTWPLLYGVDGAKIDDRKILDAAMTPVQEKVSLAGRVDGLGDLYLLADTGQTSLLRARLRLGGAQVDAAETAFEVNGVKYPPGSWIVQAARDVVDDVAARLALSFVAVTAMPDVPRHTVDLPRLALLHTWTATQDAGWARYALDQEGIEYALIADADLRRGGTGGIEDRFDVILFPDHNGDFSRLVYGIDPANGPLAYTRTPEFPSHGIP
ncbi:MAG: M14 family zinc carboxypeptidase, partial [Acidobacteriota bacterium]